jgi:hypothetical protein
LPLIVAIAWVVLGSAAVEWPGTESKEYQLNRSRLARMNLEQRRQTWQKYQEFLALAPAEQDRIRRLSAELQKQPADKQQRYRAMMDRYIKWRDGLPLYQQHMLEEAATKGSIELYATFREVQGRKEIEDRLRDYWFVPDAAPAVRKAIPKILAKLTLDEIEELDQTPPLERAGKLFAAAQRVEIDIPAPAGGPPGLGRQWLRGPLPPPDPDKFREFLQKLPREKLEELGDLGLMKRARERRLFELYYWENPDELRARSRRMEGAAE